MLRCFMTPIHYWHGKVDQQYHLVEHATATVFIYIRLSLRFVSPASE